MGYEITQFVSEVDVEFHCAICMMVLQHPMESPCEHAFCNECITKWLSINLTCPVDRSSLTLQELQPPDKIVRNLLNKLIIKCDFQPDGCPTIVRLENLKDHVSTCEYNPDAEVVCDKGCNIKMRRREYQENDCDTHLADERDRIMILIQSSQWQVYHNMTINRNEIFSADDRTFSFVQQSNPISPRNSSIKVQILAGFVDIGFSPQRHPIDVLPGRDDTSIGYNAHYGQLWISGEPDCSLPECRYGDIVEIGINFPWNFRNDGNSIVELFLVINYNLVTKQFIRMPNYAIFSTISMCGSKARVKYLKS